MHVNKTDERMCCWPRSFSSSGSVGDLSGAGNGEETLGQSQREGVAGNASRNVFGGAVFGMLRRQARAASRKERVEGRFH